MERERTPGVKKISPKKGDLWHTRHWRLQRWLRITTTLSIVSVKKTIANSILLCSVCIASSKQLPEPSRQREELRGEGRRVRRVQYYLCFRTQKTASPFDVRLNLFQFYFFSKTLWDLGVFERKCSSSNVLGKKNLKYKETSLLQGREMALKVIYAVWARPCWK